jgi:DNA invertase Pin-like site-specific DNA recombinase
VTKPTLVAIYARVSTGEQNPEAQLLALREYAARRGFSIYKEYVDRVSGDLERRRGKRQNDGAYRALMDDAGRRSFDCVLVWKYDRFARSLSILVAALQQFSTLGIDFISYTQNIDTTTAMGRLFYHVIGSFAEFEREMIVERVRAGLANARAKGKALGRPKDRGAELRIVDLRKQGLSLREIAYREERSASGVLQILRRTATSGGTE